MLNKAMKVRMQRQPRRKDSLERESSRMLVDEESERSITTAVALPTSESSRLLFILHALPALFSAENEEATTYLNQGQPYQITFRYQAEPYSSSDVSIRRFRSVVRLCFSDPRMQEHERELLDKWRRESQCSALFDVDMHSSYGVLSVLRARSAPNVLEIAWSADKAVGLFVRFHCTSTDFAAKRHGGERGIPLRLQIDTYQLSNDQQRVHHCHSCSCRIQLFRLKGAERKNRADRIRLEKVKHEQVGAPPVNYTCFQASPAVSVLYTSNLLSLVYPAHELVDASKSSEQCSTNNRFDAEEEGQQTNPSARITIYSSRDDVVHWLDQNQFSSLVSRFPGYTGCDLLRLTIDEIRQICSQDQALSLRLHHQLHETIVQPLKILYVKQPHSDFYSALYLHRLTGEELIERLRELLGRTFDEIRILVLQLKKVQIIIDSDAVVKYSLPNEGRFYLNIDTPQLTLCLKDPES